METRFEDLNFLELEQELNIVHFTRFGLLGKGVEWIDIDIANIAELIVTPFQFLLKNSQIASLIQCIKNY